jgi:hypothetical protein
MENEEIFWGDIYCGLCEAHYEIVILQDPAMTVITITKLFDLLSMKLDKETAENLTTLIEQKINSGLENKTQIFATKQDLSEIKAEIIKWMFIFWIGQVVTTFGFILLFLKK